MITNSIIIVPIKSNKTEKNKSIKNRNTIITNIA